MLKRIAVLAFSTVLGCSAADQPVPVVDEPMHRPVFENEYVRVIDVQIQPGKTTLYHRHVIPSVIVYLTKSTNRSESWPDKEILTRDVAPGQSRYAAYDEKPLAHRVTNTGSGLFRVYDIELLKQPSVQPTPAALTAPQVARHWDEKRVRSSGVQLGPNATLKVPATACASLVVAIRGKMECKPADAKSKARTLGWADYYFVPAQTAIELRNPATEPSEVVLLELKG